MDGKIINATYKTIPIKVELGLKFSTVWVNRQWTKTVSTPLLKPLILIIKNCIDGGSIVEFNKRLAKLEQEIKEIIK